MHAHSQTLANRSSPGKVLTGLGAALPAAAAAAAFEPVALFQPPKSSSWVTRDVDALPQPEVVDAGVDAEGAVAVVLFVAVVAEDHASLDPHASKFESPEA